MLLRAWYLWAAFWAVLYPVMMFNWFKGAGVGVGEFLVPGVLVALAPLGLYAIYRFVRGKPN